MFTSNDLNGLKSSIARSIQTLVYLHLSICNLLVFRQLPQGKWISREGRKDKDRLLLVSSVVLKFFC